MGEKKANQIDLKRLDSETVRVIENEKICHWYLQINSAVAPKHFAWGKNTLFFHIQVMYNSNKFIDKFMDERTNKFDGVHMYGWNGRQAYTSSLIHIMKSAISVPQSTRVSSKPSEPDHKSCPHSRYQKSSKKTTFSHQPQSNYYSVPVKNKFDILGNWRGVQTKANMVLTM